ncbi:MAG TPA: hypothetical protein VF062_22600 [Candidatus Limnocylindrales bacterium]
MLTAYPHPCLRRIEWVSELVLSLRRGSPRWVLTPDGVALLDSVALRWYVSRGRWPAKFGQPASLWLADAGCALATSPDGLRWRRLWLPPGVLDPTAVEETGDVIEHPAALPSTGDTPAPEWWLALIAPGGSPAVVASGSSAPHPVDAPHAQPASG